MEGEEEDDHSTFPKVWGVRFIRADFTAASSRLRRVHISRAPPPCRRCVQRTGAGQAAVPAGLVDGAAAAPSPPELTRTSEWCAERSLLRLGAQVPHTETKRDQRRMLGGCRGAGSARGASHLRRGPQRWPGDGHAGGGKLREGGPFCLLCPTSSAGTYRGTSHGRCSVHICGTSGGTL